ncbi:MAG: YicC family protein [Pirellula sp.]|nr:YicC family protein [Pirellula sp.]
MLLSMTGYGEAHRREADLSVGVEVRTINNRYFKLNVKCGEGYNVLESEIEQTVRDQIRRGTVQIALKIDRLTAADDYVINRSVLAGYREQLQSLYDEWHVVEQVPLETLLELPGVVTENPNRTTDVMAQWPTIRETLVAAMQNLAKMRADEGRNMAADLRQNCAAIAAELTKVEARAPQTAEHYRKRLTERVQAALSEHQITLNASDLLKEVAVYSDRADISEEIVRLRSHLDQFEKFVQADESAGRKLEFLTQEMFREINTIGSKANDVEISRYVIEIKTAVERIREMIQNVE